MRNRYRRTRNEIYGREWKKRKQEYERKIKQAKEKTWREFTEQADERTIWQIKKYLTSTPTQPFIPTLDGDANCNQQKAESLRKVFFPNPPDADTNDIPPPDQDHDTHYPAPVAFNSNITEQQIERAISKLNPNKALGPDGITNRILKKNLGILKGHICTMVQTSLDTGHFPSPFKNTITIVLRKPSKPDYRKASAYRPIALENTIGKIIESVIAEIISYLVEEHQLIPANHFGGRPGRSTEDAMLILSENIKQA
jgi:hypothetical protein